MAAPLVGDLQIRIAAGIAELQRDLNAAEARVKKFGGTVANQNRTLATAGAGFNSLRGQVQNAAFQFGDFAVQIGSGTDAMRAASQQLPQLLGGFGMWGAVIGAAVAVLGAVITQLDLFGGSADQAAKDQEKFNDQLKQLSSLMDEIRGKQPLTMEALQASVGGIIGMTRHDIENRIGQIKRELSKLPEGGAEIKPEFGGTIPLSRSEIKGLEDELKVLESRLVMLQAKAGEFGDRFEANWKHSADAIKHVQDEAKRLADQQARDAERLTEQQLRAREAIDQQIVGLTNQSELIQMTDRERAITVELLKAEETARRGLTTVTAEQTQQIREQAGALFDIARMQEYERQRQADLARLNLKETAEREAEQKKALAEEQRRIEQLANTFEDLAASLTNAALGFQSWEDAGKSAINAVFNLLFDYLDSLSKVEGGGGGGGLGGLFGSIFTAILGGLGSGGSVGAPTNLIPGAGAQFGGLYAEGGHLGSGPELIHGPANITPIDDFERGGGTTVVNNFDFRNARLVEGMVRQEIARAAPAIIDASERRVIDSRRRGGQMADAFA